MSKNSLVLEGSLLAALSTSFEKLKKTAAILNAASDDLGKTVELLDAALRKLNLGVSGWVPFNSWSYEDGSYQTHYLGYAKIRDQWGLSIKYETGDIVHGPNDDSRIEPFGDAGRDVRIQAVAAVPKLIEHLNKLATQTIERLTEKNEEARLLAVAMQSLPTDEAAR